MAHEGDNTLSCLGFIKCIELLCHFGNIFLGILKEGNTELQHDLGEVFVVEVAITVVSEVLDVVDDARILLARDDLQGLDDNLVVADAFLSEGIEPEIGSIEVARLNVLASSSTVDADGGREREENVVAGELLLVSCYGAIEGIIGLLPG